MDIALHNPHLFRLEGNHDITDLILLRSLVYFPWIIAGAIGILLVIHHALQAPSSAAFYTYQYIIGIPLFLLIIGIQLISKVDFSISKLYIEISAKGVSSKSFWKRREDFKAAGEIYKLLWVSEELPSGGYHIRILINQLDRLLFEFDLIDFPPTLTLAQLQTQTANLLGVSHSIQESFGPLQVLGMHQKPFQLPSKGGKNIGSSRMSLSIPRLFLRDSDGKGCNIDLGQKEFTDLQLPFSSIQSAGFFLQNFDGNDENGTIYGCAAIFFVQEQEKEESTILFIHQSFGEVSTANWPKNDQAWSLCLYEATLIGQALTALTGIGFQHIASPQTHQALRRDRTLYHRLRRG